MIEVSKDLIVPFAVLRRRDGGPHGLSVNICLDGLEVGTSRIIGGQVEVALFLEVQGREVKVSGTLSSSWEGECRRCLEPVNEQINIEIQEVFVEKESFEKKKIFNTNNQLAENDDAYTIVPFEDLDLEPMVRDSVLLSIPLLPLCSPDCSGVGQEKFVAEVDSLDRSKQSGDSRWKVLDALLDQDDDLIKE
tara:strand:+ start:213 stop:788 length:576 start_codon:yes stop_codon:yes gene_type:complete